MGEVKPFFGRPHVVASGMSTTERVLRAHRIVEAADKELSTGEGGSGVKLLLHAAATHLALTQGYEGSAAYVERVAASTRDRPEPEPAA